MTQRWLELQSKTVSIPTSPTRRAQAALAAGNTCGRTSAAGKISADAEMMRVTRHRYFYLSAAPIVNEAVVVGRRPGAVMQSAVQLPW